MPPSLIKFERTASPAGSIEFSRNPPKKGGYSRNSNLMQPKDLSDGGEAYVYTKGPEEQIRRLYWPNLPATDHNNYMSFVRNVAVGGSNTFTFTDYDGQTYTARIWNAENIESMPVGHERESLTVVLRLE